MASRIGSYLYACEIDADRRRDLEAVHKNTKFADLADLPELFDERNTEPIDQGMY